MEQPTLNQIYIYPVKSLGGICVQSWPVTAKGLLYDRKWMLIDENKRFLSQRRLPRMALLKTQILDDQLLLIRPDRQQLAIPLSADSGDSIEVSIWQDRCLARAVDREADRWLSDFLDYDCRLVYHPDHSVRKVDPNYALADDQTAFSDGYPFLIVSTASWQSLNRSIGQHLSITRFRPNLVISGCQEYAEDGWREISINGIDFRLPKPCSRCTVPTIDPDTADISQEPLLTLNRLRKWNKQVYFGQNALHDNTGELKVGNPVLIRRTGPHHPPL